MKHAAAAILPDLSVDKSGCDCPPGGSRASATARAAAARLPARWVSAAPPKPSAGAEGVRTGQQSTGLLPSRCGEEYRDRWEPRYAGGTRTGAAWARAAAKAAAAPCGALTRARPEPVMPRAGGGSKATSSTQGGQRREAGEELAVAGRRAGAGTRRGPRPRATSRSGGGRRRRRRRSRTSPRRRGRRGRGRGAGRKGARASSALEAVAAVDGDAGAGEGGAERGVLGRVQLIRSQPVLRAEQAAGEERRAGVGGAAVRGADGGEGAAEGGGGVGGEAGDARRRPRRSSAPRAAARS